MDRQKFNVPGPGVATQLFILCGADSAPVLSNYTCS
jgi:hypothetical protein